MLVKKSAACSLSNGTYPGARSAKDLVNNGIIFLDKPAGPTSHQVDSWIKNILKDFEVGKVSHGGTLDPRVSGVLVIALGSATKLMPILLTRRKEYVCLLNLHGNVFEDGIKQAFKRFVGKQTQLPPKRSAVARREREREVYSMDILEIDGRNVLFRVECEAGFYVRRLCDDLGRELGCGGHMQELRRIKTGFVHESQLSTLQDLSDAVALCRGGDESLLREIVKPMEIIANEIKVVVVKDSAVSAIANGAPLALGGVARLDNSIERGDWVALLSLKGEMVAIGQAFLSGKDMARKTTGFAVKTDRVLIKQEVYPKKWGK